MSRRKNFYTLQPMESNSSKCSSIQMVHSIELKFSMYIIGHRLTYCIDFAELKINSFFFYNSTKNNSYALQPVESNYKKYASV